MASIFTYLNFMLIFFSMIMFSMYMKHFLMTLINLEFLVMSIMYNVFILKLMQGSEEFLIILFMIMTVCESVIGLVILINLIRLFDIDKYKLMNFI